MRFLFGSSKPKTAAAGLGLDPEKIARIKRIRQSNAQQALSDQIADIYLTPLQPPTRWTRWGLYAIALVLVSFGAWASVALLDEVTSGLGKVVPSSREQIIQSPEGGVVAQWFVKEGDVVEAGQNLLRIDDVKIGATVQEGRTKIDALEALAARLRAETLGAEPSFDAALRARASAPVQFELATYAARKQAMQTSLVSLQQALDIAEEELRITEPMAAKGLVSELDVLRIQRSVSENKGRMREIQSKFKADAAAELARVEAELGGQKANMVGRRDSLARTVIKAPRRGVVKNIRFSTIGAVLQSSSELLEIVPLDDALLVETRIRPADIAFLHPGMTAIVKITAYDSGIYGWLDGEVLQISPDTLRDEVRREETYYKAIVRTKNAALRTPTGKLLPIIPGMQAQVDIKTGQKSVLSYLFKPVMRAREALRER